MKFNFKKIISVLTSTVMLSSTLAFAAAANYPAPFVQNGNANAAIVYGTTAAVTDLVAVTDINAHLQTKLAEQTATGTSSTSGTTVSGVDYVVFQKDTDKLNLGNSAADVFGSSVTKDNLKTLLADGTYLNDENTEYKYDQRVTLGPNLNLTFFADSSYDDKEPTVGTQIAANKFVLNYTMDFSTDAESDVVSSDLADFETTVIKLLGREYYISDADNGTNANYMGKFTMLDTANSAIVKEGETKTVTVGTTSYDVSIDSLSGSASAPQVKLKAGNEVTNSLSEGETFKLGTGVYVGVKDISMRDVAGTVSTVEFSMGSGKIEVNNGADIEFNDDPISGLKGWVVRGSASGDKQRMDKIIIQWIADDEVFVTNTSSLEMPGFKALKLSAAPFYTPAKETVKVLRDGEDKIELVVPIKDGTATFNLVYVNSLGDIVALGAATDQRLATSSTPSLTFNQTTVSGAEHEWFVASYNTSKDSESYLLSASVTESDSKNRTTIKNEVTGLSACSDKIAGDICNIGRVSLTIGTVYRTGTDRWVNFTAGSGVSFDDLYTKEGLKVFLPVLTIDDTSTTMGEIFISNGTDDGTAGHGNASYELWFAEEDKDGDVAEGNLFNVTIDDDSENDLHINAVDGGWANHKILGTSSDTISMVQSDLATTVKRIVTSSEGDAEIEYHGSQSYGELVLADATSVISGTSGGSSGTGTVRSLGSITVSDNEVSSVSTKNLIVVGGSCVNKVAAKMLGSDNAICGSAWEQATGVGAGSFLIQTMVSPYSASAVATLVAGYNAPDTTNAAKALTTQVVDASAGKKYTGNVATAITLATTATNSTA